MPEQRSKSPRSRNSDGTFRYAMGPQGNESIQAKSTVGYNDPDIRRERELRRQERDIQQRRSGTWQSSDQKIRDYAFKAKVLSDQALIDYENALRSDPRWIKDPDMETRSLGAEIERARRLRSSSWPWSRLINKRRHIIWRMHDIEMGLSDFAQIGNRISSHKFFDEETASKMQGEVRVWAAELEELKSKLRRL